MIHVVSIPASGTVAGLAQISGLRMRNSFIMAAATWLCRDSSMVKLNVCPITAVMAAVAGIASGKMIRSHAIGNGVVMTTRARANDFKMVYTIYRTPCQTIMTSATIVTAVDVGKIFSTRRDAIMTAATRSRNVVMVEHGIPGLDAVA